MYNSNSQIIKCQLNLKLKKEMVAFNLKTIPIF